MSGHRDPAPRPVTGLMMETLDSMLCETPPPFPH
jgi:hypothetical protein